MQAELYSALQPYLAKAFVSLVVAGIGALMLWPVRKVKKEWSSLKETTAKIHEELSQQRTNCLTRLQSQGDEQIKLLSKMSDTLDGVRLDFAEHRSFVQGLIQSPRRTKAYAKK
jgi:hypothetical protein